MVVGTDVNCHDCLWVIMAPRKGGKKSTGLSASLLNY